MNMKYNIFVMMNIKQPPPEEGLSRIFRALSTPTRLQIIAAIGTGEACVCHLETLLDLRQAYISQNLMELRDAEVLHTRRDGRYVYYRLAEAQLLDIFFQIGSLFGIATGELTSAYRQQPLPDCPCPHCQASQTFSLVADEEIRQL
jgi:ArsR family transcriptional regulator